MNMKHAIGTLNNIIDELDTKAECLDTVGDQTGAERASADGAVLSQIIDYLIMREKMEQSMKQVLMQDRYNAIKREQRGAIGDAMLDNALEETLEDFGHGELNYE
jgi:uncharacterized protein (UPF0218 family)